MSDLFRQAREHLLTAWEEVAVATDAGPVQDAVSGSWPEKIRKVLTCPTKSYHYVLPTQLLAKAVMPELDCRSLQARARDAGVGGAFDARSLCTKVIIPFERDHLDNVLGASPEPYVNNPLRVPMVTSEYASQQRDRETWNLLCEVLGFVEDRNDETLTRDMLRQVLIEIFRLLGDRKVEYPVPARISLSRCVGLSREFLEARSGGLRYQALATALLRVVGETFGLWKTVTTGHVNAADAASGRAGDIECRDALENLIVVAEVKHRKLLLQDMSDKIGLLRQHQVREVFFLSHGIDEADAAEIGRFQEQQFPLGYNLYCFDLLDFARPVLAILREDGRVRFLAEIGRVLEEMGAGFAHRRAWAELLLRS